MSMMIDDEYEDIDERQSLISSLSYVYLGLLTVLADFLGAIGSGTGMYRYLIITMIIS